MKEKIQCSCCNSDYEEEYYKYDNEIYCFECLTEKLENEGRLNIVKITHYYNDDWGELGTDDNMSEAIQNICENYDVEEIRS